MTNNEECRKELMELLFVTYFLLKPFAGEPEPSHTRFKIFVRNFFEDLKGKTVGGQIFHQRIRIFIEKAGKELEICVEAG